MSCFLPPTCTWSFSCPPPSLRPPPVHQQNDRACLESLQPPCGGVLVLASAGCGQLGWGGVGLTCPGTLPGAGGIFSIQPRALRSGHTWARGGAWHAPGMVTPVPGGVESSPGPWDPGCGGSARVCPETSHPGSFASQPLLLAWQDPEAWPPWTPRPGAPLFPTLPLVA